VRNIGPSSLCSAEVFQGEDDTFNVSLLVPTYQGILRLQISAERAADNDWVIHLPNTTDLDVTRDGGMILVGAPDVERSSEEITLPLRPAFRGCPRCLGGVAHSPDCFDSDGM
jgi:hypothetical protein